MRDAMEALKVRWIAQRYPSTGVRIGINTGPAIVGNIGSRDYVSYTAMGDTTNTASRLEQVNKSFGTSIIISESTHWAVKDAVVARELGTIAVRGRAEPVTIYELVALRDQPLPPEQRELLDAYAKALGAFKMQRRAEAAQLLEALLVRHPADGPSRELLRLCREAP
jgi:adenylate cyclase